MLHEQLLNCKIYYIRIFTLELGHTKLKTRNMYALLRVIFFHGGKERKNLPFFYKLI